MICLPCEFFLDKYTKCLKINNDMFGKDKGIHMCQHIKEWYDFCLSQ